MKTSWIALSLLASSAVFAQGPQGGSRRGPGGGNFDPDQRMEQRLTRHLNLTAEQQNKVHTALAERKVSLQGNREKMQTLHTSMIAAIKTGNQDQIEKTSQDMATMHHQEMAAHAKAAATIYASLSADQKTQVGDHLEMLMGHFGGPRGGPGGPRRGQPNAAAPKAQ